MRSSSAFARKPVIPTTRPRISCQLCGKDRPARRCDNPWSLCRGRLLERSSEDPDDEADNRLIGLELRQKIDPEYLQKTAKRLDVVWSVSAKKVRDIYTATADAIVLHLKDFWNTSLAILQKAKPDQCACCGGTGRGRCFFCRGESCLNLRLGTNTSSPCVSPALWAALI
jgi:hypothetical protein